MATLAPASGHNHEKVCFVFVCLQRTQQPAGLTPEVAKFSNIEHSQLQQCD